MTCKPMIVLTAIVGLLTTGLGSQASAQAVTPDAPLARRLTINALYVREAQDQAWHIRIMIPMTIPPGGYVIVYNESGDIAYHGEIPTGVYSTEAPFVVTVPADGAAQQYVVKLLSSRGVGGWNRYNGPVPMTDLPFEVYAGYGGWGAEQTFQGGKFTIVTDPRAREAKRIAFKVNPGVTNFTFAGSAGLRILDEGGGAVVAEKGTNAALVLTAPKPGQTYWVDPGSGDTFETAAKGPEKLYMTFDPERWFSPSITWDLDSRPWWKGLFKQ